LRITVGKPTWKTVGHRIVEQVFPEAEQPSPASCATAFGTFASTEQGRVHPGGRRPAPRSPNLAQPALAAFGCDRAIFEIHMATAFHFDTVKAMPLAALNNISGDVEVITRGGKVMQGKIDSKALAPVRTYLRLRPGTDSPAL
jgi:hypothetical protein